MLVLVVVGMTDHLLSEGSPSNVRDIATGQVPIPVAKCFATRVQVVKRRGRGQRAGEELRLVQLTIEFVWEGGQEKQRHKQRILFMPGDAVDAGEALQWQGGEEVRRASGSG